METLNDENEMLKMKMEELELELEIARDEGESDDEDSVLKRAARESLQNEKLKEALLRLRELSQDRERELAEQVKTLEEENQLFAEYKQKYTDAAEALKLAESNVEDLRQQLEGALGAEEMIEDLTDENMQLKDEVKKLQDTIEESESLIEVLNELEVNHSESEKQLQEEVDYKDVITAEQAKKIQTLEKTNEESEYTITRFRDLVKTLTRYVSGPVHLGVLAYEMATGIPVTSRR